MKFAYLVEDPQHKKMEGIVEATTPDEAEKFLEKRSFKVLSLKQQSPPSFSVWKKFLSHFLRVSPNHFNFFVRQLATLLKAGVPMLTCLQGLQEEEQDKVLKEATQSIYRGIEGGGSFSDSIAKHPRIFNPLFIAMAKAGETIGELDSVLSRLADVLERDYQTRKKIDSALRYPLLVVVAMAIAFLISTLFIIPRFQDLFAAFGGTLPLPTRILLALSAGLTHYWYFLLLGIVLLGVAIGYHYRTYSGRRFWDRRIFQLWGIGTFLRYAIFSRFARMLGIMLRSGVNILEALQLVAQISNNSIVSDAILRIREKINEGDTISNQMRREWIFPTLLVQMVSAGETSGKVDELLMQIAGHYDAELELMTKNMESMIEPIFILLLGFFIAILALGIFLPMWNLYSTIAMEAG